MRSFILGATGQIGSNLLMVCEQASDIVLGTWYRRPQSDLIPLDLCDEQTVDTAIRDFDPDCVYLAAGMNQIDFAEAHPDECRIVNVEGVRNVVRTVEKTSATLVYYSMAHVMGDSSSAVQETGNPNPMNVHADAVRQAEAIIRENLPDRHLIFRTHWVYGPEVRGKNPAARALRKLRSGQIIQTTNERFCQPTYGPDLAAVSRELISKNVRGTFHAVGPERMTEFAFYRSLAFIYGMDSDLIEDVSVEDLGEEAPRPHALWLDRFKLRNELGRNALRAPSLGLRDLRDRERTTERRVA